ncbi:MAG: hypothetical protein COY82_01950 [Parcubacteria group bacterium CG_4_10_14_0_8_um_filter_35_7]|nr:MAG: hypothetical protein COY82_01950 [Parcubacteria group bacterium CG_4_10_14_0_8_um_filter_35_7]
MVWVEIYKIILIALIALIILIKSQITNKRTLVYGFWSRQPVWSNVFGLWFFYRLMTIDQTGNYDQQLLTTYF